MILNDENYWKMKRNASLSETELKSERGRLKDQGYTDKQIRRAQVFQVIQLENTLIEIKNYERYKIGDFEESEFENIGQYLTAVRISRNLSQQDLAEKLNIAAEDLWIDERSEYYGVSEEELAKVAKALGVELN
jgi:ribosome-binding protein aMBF1 (putative translation factor)